jgi:hypothetical protein
MIFDQSRAIIASEGSTISGVLARFAAGGLDQRLSATIDWGDDVITAGTIERQRDGTYAVIGSHDYRVKGDFYVSVEVNAADGSYGYEFYQVLTRADELTITAAPEVYSYTTDSVAETYVASFFDREAADESAYAVTIDWGDGTTSAGRAVRAWDGSLDIVGDHAYSAAGEYAVSILVIREGARPATLSASGTALVWEDTVDEWVEVDDGMVDDSTFDECDSIDLEDVSSDADSNVNYELIGDDADDVIQFEAPESQWTVFDTMFGRPVLYALTARGDSSVTTIAAGASPERAGALPSPPASLTTPGAPISPISHDFFQAERKLTFGDSELPPVV